jgi:hypothetical protein
VTRPVEASTPRAAVAVPAYRRFLAARTISLCGNALTLVAMPVLVYRLTGSAALTAVMTAVETLPYLLVGLAAGALADRWRRRRVMVVTAAGSGAALLTVPAADAAGVLSVGQLIVVGLAVATCFVFFDAATFGVVPQLVGRDRLASATSTLVTVGTAIAVVGPLVGGVLVTVAPPAWVIGVDALAYLVAAWLLAGLRWQGSEDRTSRPGRPALRVDITEGLRAIRDHPVVLRLTVLGIGSSLAGGATTGLLVVVGVQQLGLGADDPALGRLFAAAAAGTFVAGLLLPRLQARAGVGVITTVGFVVAFAALQGLAATRSLAVALAVVAVFHAATTTLIVNGIVTRQVVTPAHLQSRVNTTARLVAWGGSPLGAVLAGLLAESAGTQTALRVASLGLLVSVVGAVFSGLLRVPRLAEIERPAD